MLQITEVENDDGPDEEFQNDKELYLRDQVCLAGLVDQFRDLEHRLVYREVFQLVVNDNAEHETERNNNKAVDQEVMAVDCTAKEGSLAEIWDDEVGFASRLRRRSLRKRG